MASRYGSMIWRDYGLEASMLGMGKEHGAWKQAGRAKHTLTPARHFIVPARKRNGQQQNDSSRTTAAERQQQNDNSRTTAAERQEKNDSRRTTTAERPQQDDDSTTVAGRRQDDSIMKAACSLRTRARSESAVSSLGRLLSSITCPLILDDTHAIRMSPSRCSSDFPEAC